jgi:hypothetical protein
MRKWIATKLLWVGWALVVIGYRLKYPGVSVVFEYQTEADTYLSDPPDSDLVKRSRAN